jgi:predicted MFS family arabinose efflux permease
VRDLKASFWLLFTGQLTSAVGTASTAVAMPLVVLQITGDLVQAGLMAFVVAAAAVAGRFPGGVLADRFDRRLLMISCDLVRLAGMAALAVAVSADHASLPLFVVVGVVEGLLGSVFAPAASGAVRQFVDESSWPRALGLMQSVSAVAMVAGPLLGGVLVLWHPAMPFGFDTVTYLISAVCLTSIRRRVRVPGSPEGLFQSAMVGLRFVVRSPFLLYAALNAAVLNLVFNGLILVLVATSAEPGQDSAVTGVQVAALGAGMLLGSTVAPVLADRLRPEHGIAVSTAATGPPMAMFALVQTGWPSLVLIGLTAATAPLVNVLVGTQQMRMTPDALQGRVHSAVTLLSMAAAPLGPILAGISVRTVGITHTVLFAAAVVVLLAVAGWWVGGGQFTRAEDEAGTRTEPFEAAAP